MKIVKTILCVLFGLMFINAGLNKFFFYMPVPPMEPEMQRVFEAMMTITWLMPLVGFVETVGGVLFIIPKTRALGAIVILPVMVGIVLHNTLFAPGAGLVIVFAMLAINVWIIAENWSRYKPMLA